MSVTLPSAEQALPPPFTTITMVFSWHSISWKGEDIVYHIRTYWWCSPDRIGSRTAGSPDLGATHRPAATLSNVKGKRDAPSLPANVTCLHNTQTNRSEPTM